MATYLVVTGIPDPFAKATLEYDHGGSHRRWDHTKYTLFDALAAGCRPAPRPPYGWFILPWWRDSIVNHDPYGDTSSDTEPSVAGDGPDANLGGDGRLIIFSGWATCGYTIDAPTLADAVAATAARIRALPDFDPLLTDVHVCAGVTAAEPDGWDGAVAAYDDAFYARFNDEPGHDLISDGTTRYRLN